MGYTGSLDELGIAPPAGWSPTKDVLLIAGHTYIVKTWDDHYAKIRVLALSPAKMEFDWAYQLQEGNRYLKAGPTVGRGILELGSSARDRH